MHPQRLRASSRMGSVGFVRELCYDVGEEPLRVHRRVWDSEVSSSGSCKDDKTRD